MNNDSLEMFNRLVDSALIHAGDGLVSEKDAVTDDFLYTETHLALLLFLLNRAGVRQNGLSEAANRLQVWNSLQVRTTFFNCLAITLLTLLMREENIADVELENALAEARARRIDFADEAWQRECGNNLYLQQLVNDLLLGPLADSRHLAEDARERLDKAFASCMDTEGYFFDTPRPGATAQRQFPFTYNLKYLLLLAICCRYLPDASFKRRFRVGVEAILPLFTKQGDFSYFGRTDRSTFATGLAIFCLRAAASMDIGGQFVRWLALHAEQLFNEFPVGEDGCLEVNRYPLPATVDDLIFSRDVYAYRWQYAIVGCAYCMLGRHLFSFHQTVNESGTADKERSIFSSASLGIVRVQIGYIDLFIRTKCDLMATDRRHFGPTILRLEHGGNTVVGTIPVTVSSDSSIMVKWSGRSLVVRHFDLLRYRWRHGFEHRQWELVGFLPVLRRHHRAWIPMSAVKQQIDGDSLVTIHSFQGVYISGWIPAWNHFKSLVVKHVPTLLKPMFRERSLLEGEVSIKLARTIRWNKDSVSIVDQVVGEIEGKELVVGTRLLNSRKIQVVGLTPGGRQQGWSSDGPQEIQLYHTPCSGNECRYEIIVSI